MAQPLVESSCPFFFGTVFVVHASAMPIDCRCRVLDKARHRVVILSHCAPQTSFHLILESPNLALHLPRTSFNQAVPKRLALHVCSWMISYRPSCHRRQGRQSQMADHGCFPIRSHELPLASTSHQLLAEDYDVSLAVALALKEVGEHPHIS